MNEPTMRRLAAVALLLVGARVAAQEPADFARCNAIDDATERLACYDTVSGRTMPSAEPAAAAEPKAAPAPAAVSEPAATPEPAAAAVDAKPVTDLTDEVGEEQLDRPDRPTEEPTLVRGTVTDCKRDASDKYYFYFDNGQVWKQKNSARMQRRSCFFGVTIEKDFFGYKMRIDGEKSEIRISRVR